MISNILLKRVNDCVSEHEYVYISVCFGQAADGALRCFASLADRFTRLGVDPAPLAQSGLVEDLLERLIS